MTLWDIVVSPVSIAILALCAGYLTYSWSKKVAPPFLRTRDKAMPYVGGEAAEPAAFQPGYAFFSVALFFTIVHVAALIIALAPPDAPLWATLGYLAIIAAAIFILRWEQ